MPVDFKPEILVATAASPAPATRPAFRQSWFNWRTAAIVAAICLASAFFFEVIADLLVSAEVVTVIVVAAIFFVLLGFCAFRSRALAERPKWFIFSVWGLLLASEEIFSYINDATSTYESQFAYAAYAQAAIWMLAAIALLIFLQGNPGALKGLFTGNYKWSALFALVALFSVAYAPQVAFSLAWAFKLCLIVVVLQVISKQLLNLDDISAFFLASIVAYVFLVGAPSIRSLMPDPTSDYGSNEFETRMREGPTGLSAAAGTFALLALTLYTPDKNTKKRGLLVLAIVGLAVMIIAGGKAAIVAGVFSGLLFYGLQKRVGATLGFMAGIVLIFWLALTFTPLSQYMSAYTSSGQVTSLTGRTELWAFVWPAVKQRILQGHGYVSSRFVSVAMPGTPFQAGHMHNGFLEALYNNGLIGLFLIVMVHVVIVRNLWKTLRGDVSPRVQRLAIGSMAIYTNLFINGMFNATFSGRAGAPFMMLLALVIVSERLAKEIKQPKRAPSSSLAPAWT
jgi:O-antigen ligase